jgi:DNA-binding PadR family transcriptional regulator
MSALIITSRDVQLFEYLHSCKVATIKQINRDIFQTSRGTCYQRIKKYQEKKFIKAIGVFQNDINCHAYEVTPKGEKIIKANLRDIMSGNRFRSNSIEHDLFLVDIKNIFTTKKMVKSYFTENQIQTYFDFRSEENLQPFQEMQSDACLILQKNDYDPIHVALELELSTKAIDRYRQKIRELYYLNVFGIFYICQDKNLIKKLQKIDEEVRGERRTKIYFSTLEEIFKSNEEVIFYCHDGTSLPVY